MPPGEVWRGFAPLIPHSAKHFYLVGVAGAAKPPPQISFLLRRPAGYPLGVGRRNRKQK